MPSVPARATSSSPPESRRSAATCTARRHRPAQPELFAEAEARTVERTPAAGEPWTPLAGLPDVYIAMGQTAENVAEYKKVSRQEQDEFALQSQTRAVAAQEAGFFDREIIPVTTPTGTW
jgi:acetyl-CoA C-acetyltransferase